jgi:inosine-uridine nucleoside N-ribohydrolase
MRPVVLITALALFLAGCQPNQTVGDTDTSPTMSSSEESEQSPTEEAPAYTGEVTSVVVDTDMSTDDLMAIAMLVMSPRVEVAAVTITGAFVRCPRGEELMLDYLHTLGASDIPVACGATAPLEGTRAFPDDWRNAADGAWGIPLGDSGAAPAAEGGVALLAEQVNNGVTHVVVLGPHTNMAQALRNNPDMANSIDLILTMGGAVDVAGNVYGIPGAPEAKSDSVVEWNIYVDPVAASEVFGSGIPVVMVGLDATDDVPVESAFVDRMKAEGTGTAIDLMVGMIERNKLSDQLDSYFWDQLAVAYLLDPAVVSLEQTAIRVVTGSGEESGRTLRDTAGTTISIATAGNRSLLEDLMIGSLSGRF